MTAEEVHHDVEPTFTLPFPPPIASSRCVSTESAASILSVRSRLNRIKYVLLIDQEKKEAVLQRCSCPRCAGVLRFRRVVEEEDYGVHANNDANWEEDEESLLMMDFPKAGSIRGVTDEEIYEMKSMTKATRRTGDSAARTKSSKKTKDKKMTPTQLAASAEKKKEARTEMAQELAEARKKNVEKRIAKHRRGQMEATLSPFTSSHSVLWRSSQNNHRTKKNTSKPTHLQAANGETIISAPQLGIDTTSDQGRRDYERLLAIMRGDEINPNDYDLLLSLDETVEKKTLELKQVEAFPTLSVQDLADTNNGMCLVCLTPFKDMEDGAQIRKLPCQHMYCKDCIDTWLTSTSQKCPELSCFWTTAGTSEDNHICPTATADNTNGTTANDASLPPPPATETPTASSANTNNNQTNTTTTGECSTITSAIIQSASSDLWSISDLTSSLNKPSEEGGLCIDVVLEQISEVALAVQHFDTIMALQKIYDDLENGASDEEDIKDDILEMYSDFCNFLDSN